MRTRVEIETCFAERSALDSVRSFFFVGIGGAGMSGVARMLNRRGFRVRGTDSTEGEGVEAVRGLGIEVHIGHSGAMIEPGDALVLTDAIDLKTSPEVARAKELGCLLFRRSQVLGWLLRDKKTIAVTGTHGKTTTTGMVGAGLLAAGLDPTIVVGAEVPEFGGAVVEGTGKWAVVEACEAYDSLRDFDPDVVVLTNLELDHVDFHGNWDGLKRSVLGFVNRIPAGGHLLYCADDEGAAEIASETRAEAVPYAEASDLHPHIPGRHNRVNAEGALRACLYAGADPGKAKSGIEGFRGAGRRLQVLREGPITVIDDYAHHPTEIDASIQAIRERHPDRRLLVVYQPHLYSRTADLIPEFAAALSKADVLVLTDIYPAREAPMPGVSSARIAEAASCPVHFIPQRHLLPRKVAAMAQPGDVVVGMGAGNIADFAPAFLTELDRSGPTRVAVAFGGDSAEREISLHSGRQVQSALSARGYDAYLVDFSEALLTGRGLPDLVGDRRPDIVFLAVHGTHAEDGAIQGLLELLHLPYTGSGIQSSAMAMDKELTKSLLSAAGLPVPAGILTRTAGNLPATQDCTAGVPPASRPPATDAFADPPLPQPLSSAATSEDGQGSRAQERGAGESTAGVPPASRPPATDAFADPPLPQPLSSAATSEDGQGLRAQERGAGESTAGVPPASRPPATDAFADPPLPQPLSSAATSEDGQGLRAQERGAGESTAGVPPASRPPATDAFADPPLPQPLSSAATSEDGQGSRAQERGAGESTAGVPPAIPDLNPSPSLPEWRGERWVVKPNQQGSTVGLSFVDDEADLPAAIEKALQYGDEALVEERVMGTEISVPVLGDRVLPVVEIVPASGEYDFASKYLPGATEEICPARLSEEVTRRASDYALRAHRALRCQGATRTDMIVREDGECVVLEVNTLPGMTATSLLPNSARAAGISFEDLCAWIVEDALSRANART
ncbi:MAG: hypothetical protein K1X67_11825 [Fimbriimonadaceae bacterium]|nr:hypothetical protein [Fimbriimonadaceae bacterium]